MAKPVDVRLWRRVGATRGYVALTVILQAASVGLVIAQALVISALVADLVNDGVVSPARMTRDVALLLIFAVIRAVLVWAQDRFAPRAAGRVIGDLRAMLLGHLVTLGPRWRGRDGPTEDPAVAAVTATQGLDALEPYLVQYLPALLLTVLATPVVLVVIGWLDPIALVICLLTLPLVPVFMWLVGQMTAGTSERRLAVVSRLGAQVLDLLTGLPTLRAFGREIGPGVRVRALGEAARSATMGTMRIAFLSAMVLELLSTLSVAIVAVSVGLRLVDGAMSLRAGLAAIMLAPEVFAPLRQVAAQFHASRDGLAASDAAFALLDEPLPGAGSLPEVPPQNLPGVEPGIRQAVPPQNLGSRAFGDPGVEPGEAPAEYRLVTAIEFDDVSVVAGDRELLAPAHLSARIELPPPDALGSGQIVALVGPTGSGKSTTALLLLGLIRPDEGRVRLETAAGTTASPDEMGPEWWRQIVWVPQRPARDPATVGLSVGQRHRVALREALGSALSSDSEAFSVTARSSGGAHSPSADFPVIPRPRGGAHGPSADFPVIPRPRSGAHGPSADFPVILRPRSGVQRPSADFPVILRPSGGAQRPSADFPVMLGLQGGAQRPPDDFPVILRPRSGAQNPSARSAVPASARILLLDEPTAHLDSASEEQVAETLRAWRDSGRTAIVIAHRPALISLADQVIEVHAEGLATTAQFAIGSKSLGTSISDDASAPLTPAHVEQPVGPSSNTPAEVVR